MTDHPNFVIRSLVRSYSDNLNDKSQSNDNRSPSRRMVEEAFCEEVERQDALAALMQQAASNQSREASKKLQARFEELEAAFKDFRDTFPELVKEQELSNSMSWPSLHQAIAKLQANHDTKTKKGVAAQSKRRFHRICRTLDNHSGVLKILPQGDKYTSVVCGSLELIVKASVNHEQIGEDFAAALEEIDEIVADVREELALYQADHIKDQSIRLCCRILSFISFPLTWYSQKKRKRLFASFNENLSAEYKTHIQEIRRISDHIRRGVQLCTAREVRSILGLVKYHHNSQELYQRENWRMHNKDWQMFHSAIEEHNRTMQRNGQQFLTNMSQQLGGMFGNNIGQPMKNILDREAEVFVNGKRELPSNRATSTSSGENTPEPETRSSSPSSTTREDVEKASEILNPFFEFDQIAVTGSDINNFVETEAIQRLQVWTEQNVPGILGIFGPPSLSYDSSARLLASNYVKAAKDIGIPCISYFCSTQTDDPPEGRLRETIGLVSLLYGLIKQLMLFLPIHMDAQASSLMVQQFELLDGTLHTWRETLSLFNTLLGTIEPPYLIIVIHGIELLEHAATNEYIIELVEVFRRITMRHESDGKIFKILFTTSGLSQVLATELEDEEVSDLNRGGAAHSPGQAKKGRTSMGNISYAEH